VQSVYIHWLRSEIKRKLHRQRKQLPTLVTEKRPPSLYLFILVLAQTSTKSPSAWHVQLLYLFWCWPRPAQKARQPGMYSCFIYFGAGPDQHKKPVNLACTAALFILVLAQTSSKSPSTWHVQLLYLFWCWPRPVQKARQSGMYNCFVSFGAGSDQHKKPVSLACTAAFFLYFGAGSDQYKTPISLACTAACTAGLYSFRSCTPFVNPL